MNVSEKLLLTEKEAAELLSMSTHYLRRDRISPGSACIPFIKVGAAVRYRRADLEKWIDEQANKHVQHKAAPPSNDLLVEKRRRGRPKKAEQIAIRRNMEKANQD